MKKRDKITTQFRVVFTSGSFHLIHKEKGHEHIKLTPLEALVFESEAGDSPCKWERKADEINKWKRECMPELGYIECGQIEVMSDYLYYCPSCGDAISIGNQSCRVAA